MRPSLKYEPLEKIEVARPIDRLAYIREQCAGRNVLDLGAMDETAFAVKRGKGTWLHEEIARAAARVIGLDNSPEVPEHGLPTGPRSAIHRGDIHNLHEFLAEHDFVPDIVVAGELIEHVPNALDFLRSLTSMPNLRGKTMILTTPNATALHNCLIALLNRESTHHDHLCILSYKTLNTLFLRSGFREWEIRPYYSRFTEMKERVGMVRSRLIGACETGINLAETLWPLLSFGLVGRATI
jgi:2-polyprenyl-3-methyl-5-hydroxy-6-metoxy-1,4-benzoquinol methylase